VLCSWIRFTGPSRGLRVSLSGLRHGTGYAKQTGCNGRQRIAVIQPCIASGSCAVLFLHTLLGQPPHLQVCLAKVVAERRAIATKVHDAAALQDQHPAPPSICMDRSDHLTW